MSINNILAVYQQATEAEKQEGIAWYKEARTFCHDTAKEYSVSIEVVIAVVSALSPRNKWKTNLKDTITVLEAVRQGKFPEDVKTSTFHRNKEKAFRIIQESNSSLVEKSNKTAAFFDNIKAENSLMITVDTHANAIYHGEAIHAKRITNKAYQQISDDYRLVALEVGLKGYQLQAVCWVTWQRLRTTKPTKILVLT